MRSLVNGFRLADPNVTTEPAGLTSTLDRPADILTTAAVPGRSAALDVCIASPNAAIAAGDAAAAAFRRKLRRYRRAIPELARAGIVFRPMVWTADARPHPAVVRTLRYAVSISASRNVESDSAPLMLNRWKHEITVAIMRRRAAMSRAVLQRRGERQRWLVSGRTSARPSSDIRAPPLDESGDEGDPELEEAVDDRLDACEEDEPPDVDMASAAPPDVVNGADGAAAPRSDAAGGDAEM